MKLFSKFTVFILIVSLWWGVFNNVNAQSEELKTAKESLKESYEKFDKDPQELELRKDALKEVIKFSIIGTQDLISKLNSFKDVSAVYSELKDNILVDLNGFLDYQSEYLKNFDSDDLALDGVQDLAAAFKKWREEVYDPQIKKALNFILVFQGSEILTIVTNRFRKIAGDLRLLRNSKVIKVEALLPILDEAGILLKEAASFHNDAAVSLLATTSVSKKEITGLMGNFIVKIKQVYGKFLEMSNLVKKMITSSN